MTQRYFEGIILPCKIKREKIIACALPVWCDSGIYDVSPLGDLTLNSRLIMPHAVSLTLGIHHSQVANMNNYKTRIVRN